MIAILAAVNIVVCVWIVTVTGIEAPDLSTFDTCFDAQESVQEKGERVNEFALLECEISYGNDGVFLQTVTASETNIISTINLIGSDQK